MARTILCVQQSNSRKEEVAPEYLYTVAGRKAVAIADNLSEPEHVAVREAGQI